MIGPGIHPLCRAAPSTGYTTSFFIDLAYLEARMVYLSAAPIPTVSNVYHFKKFNVTYLLVLLYLIYIQTFILFPEHINLGLFVK